MPSATILPRGVPGIQVDGYFPDTSTFNTNHGWNHDAQFVIRLPDHWNGRLVITGAPGVHTQYTQDPNISDKVISEGYAYASTDKGNGGSTFYTDGTNPGDALVEWNQRVTQLAIAAKATMVQRYGHRARFTYITGVSNGGYFTRWELENHPELFDGGVDWEGTLFNTTGHNLLDYLPVALREYPKYRATGDQAAHQAMLDAGFPAGSEYLWNFYYTNLWDYTQRLLRKEVDPSWDGGPQAGHPFCQSGTPDCDADYQFSQRPDAQQAMDANGVVGPHQEALDHTPRHARSVPADRQRFRPVRAPRARGGKVGTVPVLPDRRRQPPGRIARPLPPSSAHPAVLLAGLHAHDRLGRTTPASARQQARSRSTSR